MLELWTWFWILEDAEFWFFEIFELLLEVELRTARPETEGAIGADFLVDLEDFLAIFFKIYVEILCKIYVASKFFDQNLTESTHKKITKKRAKIWEKITKKTYFSNRRDKNFRD